VLFLTAPCNGRDWGKSPLTGKPQGFEKDCSPPVGDFGFAGESSEWEGKTQAPPLMYRWPHIESDDFQKDGPLWHKRVSELINRRFNQSAKNIFSANSTLRCRVSYWIFRDGRVEGVAVLKRSTSPQFDALVVAAIKSIAHDPILVFPPGSLRVCVVQTAIFTWDHSLQVSLEGQSGENSPNIPSSSLPPKPEVK